MPSLSMHVRLDYAQHTTPSTLSYECKRCGRKTKTYRKITRHLRSCAKHPPLRGAQPRALTAPGSPR
jgi:hypothetical protein